MEAVLRTLTLTLTNQIGSFKTFRTTPNLEFLSSLHSHLASTSNRETQQYLALTKGECLLSAKAKADLNYLNQALA